MKEQIEQKRKETERRKAKDIEADERLTRHVDRVAVRWEKFNCFHLIMQKGGSPITVGAFAG